MLFEEGSRVLYEINFALKRNYTLLNKGMSSKVLFIISIPHSTPSLPLKKKIIM